jgi:hypothetical protein
MPPAKKPDKLSNDYADDNLKLRDTRNGSDIMVQNVWYECQTTSSQSSIMCIMKFIGTPLLAVFHVW